MSSTQSFVMKLLSHVEEISKKPQVDQQLGDMLDQFMEHVRESDTYLDNGIFKINFAEVALFLQNCAQVYGKKVDMLYDRVYEYQHEMIALERETAKREQAELLAKERQMRYKRKRKLEETHDEANMNELLQMSLNVQKSLSPCENLQRSWMYAQVRDRIYNQDTTTRDQFLFRGNKCPIPAAINTDCENIIAFDKMHLNEVVFELSEKYPLFVGGSQGKNPQNVAHFYENDAVLQDFLMREQLNYLEVEKIYREKYRLFYADHLTTKANSACTDASNTMCPKRLMTHVKRLSEDVLQQYLKKDPALISAKIKRASSTAPSLGGNDSGYFDYTEEETTDETMREDVTLSLSSENSEQGIEEIAVEASNCEDLPTIERNCEDLPTMESNNCDDLPTEDNCEEMPAIDEELPAVEDLPAVEAPIETKNAVDEEKTIVEEVKERCMKRKKRDLSEERCSKKRKKELNLEDKTPKRVRRSLRIRPPKIKMTAALTLFEDFMAKNYTPEEGEGSLEVQTETIHPETTIADDAYEAPATPSFLQIEIEIVDPETTVVDGDDDDDDDEGGICDPPATPYSLDPHPETTVGDASEKPESPVEILVFEELETGSVSECDMDTTEDTTPTQTEVNNNKETGQTSTETAPPPTILNHSIMKRLEEEKKQREKVEEWKHFITTKLDKLNEKADFDIHHYGAQIMDNLTAGENKKFAHVVQGKKSAEVCRLFLASLQLACTENVEIVNACPSGGGIVNETLELKLLSRECYHENLGSYMAPSEESFDERMRRARRH